MVHKPALRRGSSPSGGRGGPRQAQQLLVELPARSDSEPELEHALAQRAESLAQLRDLEDELGRGLVSWAVGEVDAEVLRRLARSSDPTPPQVAQLARFLRLRVNPPLTATDLRAAWTGGPVPGIFPGHDPADPLFPEGAIKELARIPGEVMWQPNLGEPPGGLAVFDHPGWPGRAGLGVKLAFLAPGYERKHPDYRELEVRELRPPTHDKGLGTWTLGVLFAQSIHRGLVGICPRAEPLFLRPWTERGSSLIHSGADAIALACTALEPGDVLLLAHTGLGPPTEDDPAAFVAIQLATALGIHVIEAAGDSPMDLDDEDHQGRYDRRRRDSGAVMVTGYLRQPRPPPSPTRVRGAWGHRVDCHAPAPIYTTKPSGTRRHLAQWFQGSSAAAVQVAGLVALASGAVRAERGAPVDPATMRRLLTATGTPAMMETDGPIAGTQPNLMALLEALRSRADSLDDGRG
jgi:serine protease